MNPQAKRVWRWRFGLCEYVDGPMNGVWNESRTARRMSAMMLHRTSTGLLTSALLTVALAGLAAIISSWFKSPALAMIADALAFVAAGWATLRLVPGAHALESAMGGGAAVLLFGLVQVVGSDLQRELGWRVILTSLSLSLGRAVFLSWLGALLASGGRPRRSIPFDAAGGHHLAPELESSVPESRPAHSS
jgi:hypothetical protein